MNHVSYPKSFPSAKEEKFLKLILCEEKDFRNAWNSWKQDNDFNDIGDAEWHLFPLIYERMQRLGMQDDRLFGKIRGIYKIIWVRNQQILASVKDIYALLGREHIPAVLLKGIPMLLEVYGNIGARLTGDIDLFIPPQYAPRVVALMIAHGWTYTKPWMPDVNNPVPSMYRVSKSTDFMNHHGILADIHWNIFGLYHHARRIDILLLEKHLPTVVFREIYFKHAVPLSFPNLSALRLGNEDMLIHAIIHGSENSVGRGIRWVTDAAAIIHKFPIRWDVIIDRSKEFELQVELAVAFRYLSEHMHLPIPRSFLDELFAIPFTQIQVTEFYRRANMAGGERFSPMNNFLMFWYAYWRYAPKQLFGFIRYTARSLGIGSSGKFWFIMKKYFKKIFRQIKKGS